MLSRKKVGKRERTYFVGCIYMRSMHNTDVPLRKCWLVPLYVDSSPGHSNPHLVRSACGEGNKNTKGSTSGFILFWNEQVPGMMVSRRDWAGWDAAWGGLAGMKELSPRDWRTFFFCITVQLYSSTGQGSCCHSYDTTLQMTIKGQTKVRTLMSTLFIYLQKRFISSTMVIPQIKTSNNNIKIKPEINSWTRPYSCQNCPSLPILNNYLLFSLIWVKGVGITSSGKSILQEDEIMHCTSRGSA